MIFRLKIRKLSKAVQGYKSCLKIISSKNDNTPLNDRGRFYHICLHRSEGLSYVLAPFTGRSDYGPFIAEGTDIPGMRLSS